MASKSIKFMFLAAILAIGLASAVHAGSSTLVYDPATHGCCHPTTYGADPASLATVGSSGVHPTQQRQTISLSATFSTAAATAKLRLVRGDWDGQTWRPVDTLSATVAASSSYTIGGRYVADSANFDAGGLAGFQVLVETTSAGDVEVNYVLR